MTRTVYTKFTINTKFFCKDYHHFDDVIMAKSAKFIYFHRLQNQRLRKIDKFSIGVARCPIYTLLKIAHSSGFWGVLNIF